MSENKLTTTQTDLVVTDGQRGLISADFLRQAKLIALPIALAATGKAISLYRQRNNKPALPIRTKKATVVEPIVLQPQPPQTVQFTITQTITTIEITQKN